MMRRPWAVQRRHRLWRPWSMALPVVNPRPCTRALHVAPSLTLTTAATQPHLNKALCPPALMYASDAGALMLRPSWVSPQQNTVHVCAAARLSEHQRAMDMHRAQVEGQQAALLAESAQAAMQAEVEQGLRAKVGARAGALHVCSC